MREIVYRIHQKFTSFARKAESIMMLNHVLRSYQMTLRSIVTYKSDIFEALTIRSLPAESDEHHLACEETSSCNKEEKPRET